MYVLSRDAEIGEAHVRRNLQCIREDLAEFGIPEAEIEAEVHLIESAVRREMWRQVILKGRDQ